MSIPHNNQGPPPGGPLPLNNNGPPPVVRPNGPAPQSIEELCQSSIHGQGVPTASNPIQATDFGLRHHMIQQQNRVFDDTLRLSLFLYSLTHHATAWYDRLVRNSIHTFEDMIKKFLSIYFPPLMVTKLRNEITKFIQDPNKSLFEAWERYKSSIDRCPNHNMLLVTQIDTFYNGLTLRYQDTINAAAGGTFTQKTPEECYDLIENMTAHHNHWDSLATRDETSRTISSTTTTTESPKVVRQLEMINKNFLDMMRQIQSVKSVIQSARLVVVPILIPIAQPSVASLKRQLMLLRVTTIRDVIPTNHKVTVICLDIARIITSDHPVFLLQMCKTIKDSIKEESKTSIKETTIIKIRIIKLQLNLRMS
nr:hypothetical protein [Tanacetum cinerariifolium]